MGTPIDELELTDDPTGSCHRHIHHIRRTNRTDRPWPAKRPTIDRDRAIRRPREVALRTDPHVVHPYRLGARVAQLVHEVGERTLAERAPDPARDAGAADRALGAEDPQLRDLTFCLGQRTCAARG